LAKLTSEDKEKIVQELIRAFKELDMLDECLFYYNNKRVATNRKTGEPYIDRKECDPRDYMDYCNENTITIGFEGSNLYEVLNGYLSDDLYETVFRAIEKIVAPYGLFWELGNSWNLSFYDTDYDDNEPEPQEEEIGIHQGVDVPIELLQISKYWAEKANAYGDAGSCVLGAGFKFRYQDKLYFMPPLTHWQGSCSWEAYKDEIQEKLYQVGATEISYEWGRMD
jgi:hypothetical protein